MNKRISFLREMRAFLLLWLTQALSGLGSAMTSFALVIWSYQAEGSALSTALLSVCSYAPYVLMSIFAGAFSDRWSKKATLLLCDTLAALTTLAVLMLLKTDNLRIWHLYVLNAVNGLMNTVQQPASEVAITLLTPARHVQRASSLQQLSGSLNSILTPALTSALMAFAGLDAVILLDLATFAAAALALLLFIRIPDPPAQDARQGVLHDAKQGLQYLWCNRGVLDLILFLAAINFVASIYQAALPALVLTRAGEVGYGILNTVVGVATLAGSALSVLLPAPRSRTRVICNALLFSMSTENFLLAFGRSVPVWCVGAAMGWFFIPLMNTNLNALLRSIIPLDMQGRVYAARNSLQFFTIPLGYLAGGLLVDSLFEPLMASQPPGTLLPLLFGTGKGAGASLLYFLLGLLGITVCLCFRCDQHIRALD